MEHPVGEGGVASRNADPAQGKRDRPRVVAVEGRHDFGNQCLQTGGAATIRKPAGNDGADRLASGCGLLAHLGQQCRHAFVVAQQEVQHGEPPGLLIVRLQ